MSRYPIGADILYRLLSDIGSYQLLLLPAAADRLLTYIGSYRRLHIDPNAYIVSLVYRLISALRSHISSSAISAYRLISAHVGDAGSDAYRLISSYRLISAHRGDSGSNVYRLISSHIVLSSHAK